MSTGGGGAGGERLGGIYFDIQGRTGDLYREFDRTQKQARQVEEELKRLKAQVKAGEIGYAEYAQKAAALAESKRRIQAESSRLRGALDAESATVGKASAATERYAARQGWLRDQQAQAGEGSSKFAYRLSQVGATLEDLQYVGEMGLRPILNNIMQISSVLGIAAVAAYTLYQNWDQLMGAMGLGKVESEAEEMERLAKATERTAQEEEKLKRYKESRESAGRMSDKSDAQQASQREFEDTIRNSEGGLEGLKAAMVRARNPEGLEARLSDEERRALEKARTQQITTEREEGFKKEREILDRARKAEMDRAGADVGAATGDAGRQKGLINEVARFDPVLAEKLRGSTVGAVDERGRGEESEKEWRRQQDEAEQRSVEQNKEIADREKKRQKTLQERAKEAANAGQDRYLGDMLENQNREATDPKKLTDDQFQVRQVDAIRKHLLDTGQAADEEEARELGDLVAKQLREGAIGAIRKRVNEEGITPEQASERMLDERREKEEARKKAEEAKAERESKAERRKIDEEHREQARLDKMAAEEARATLPAVDEKVREAMIEGRLAFGDVQKADDHLAQALGQELVDKGMTPEDASRAAIDIIDQQSKRLSDDVAKRAMQKDRAEAPQFLGAAEMVRKAQASVMKDVGKDQLDQLVLMVKGTGRTNELLERMGNNKPRLGP